MNWLRMHKKIEWDIDMEDILDQYKKVLMRRDEVVSAAIDGLISGGMTNLEANNLRLLLTKVYELGYDDGRRDGM